MDHTALLADFSLRSVTAVGTKIPGYLSRRAVVKERMLDGSRIFGDHIGRCSQVNGSLHLRNWDGRLRGGRILHIVLTFSVICR